MLKNEEHSHANHTCYIYIMNRTPPKVSNMRAVEGALLQPFFNNTVIALQPNGVLNKPLMLKHVPFAQDNTGPKRACTWVALSAKTSSWIPVFVQS
eukprot:1158208-Pelagomonas_calceolata.AAC.58